MSKYEFKGTPGPWVKDGIGLTGSNGEPVIMSDGPGFGSKSVWPHAEANGIAVKAVPELISEGANLVAVLEGEGGTKPDALCRFKAALAKATGERTGGES